MRTSASARFVIVSDDLTGAADTAVAFAPQGPTSILLSPAAPHPGTARFLAVDTDARHRTAAVARERTSEAVALALAAGAQVYLKIDSVLRGHPAVSVRAALHTLRTASGRRHLAIAAPAFPATGRTTHGGIVHVDGEPLPDGTGHLPDLLAEAGLTVETVGLTDVRRPGLAARLAEAGARGADVVVLDATRPEDLTVIAQAAAELSDVLHVGSGGLARHLGPSAPQTRPAGGADSVTVGGPLPEPVPGPVLTLVGSHTSTARDQSAALAATATAVVMPGPYGPSALQRARPQTPALAEVYALLRSALSAGQDVIVTPDRSLDVDPEHAQTVAAALGALLADHAHLIGALVATGGDTARAALTCAGIVSLDVVGELEPGVVLLRTADARQLQVITKSGGFGDRETLVRAVSRLHAGSLTYR